MRDNLLFALVARLWAAELVTAAYVGILGRLPDDEGLRAHCALRLKSFLCQPPPVRWRWDN